MLDTRHGRSDQIREVMRHQSVGQLLAPPGKFINPFFGHGGKIGWVTDDFFSGNEPVDFLRQGGVLLTWNSAAGTSWEIQRRTDTTAYQSLGGIYPFPVMLLENFTQSCRFLYAV